MDWVVIVGSLIKWQMSRIRDLVLLILARPKNLSSLWGVEHRSSKTENYNIFWMVFLTPTLLSYGTIIHYKHNHLMVFSLNQAVEETTK